MSKKTIVLSVFVLLAFTSNSQTETPKYDYKLFTTIESVVPGGLGRSRMISTDNQSQVQEKDLENFFSLVGINFKNIQNNDVIITSKMNEMAKEGYELDQTTSGVYSAEKSTGIFITRYIFRKLLK